MVRRTGILAVLTALATSAVAAALPITPAQAQPSPSLRVSPATLSGAGTVTVTGSNYLVPPHAPGTPVFGGVYVFFGWVAGGNWGPSARNSSNNNGTFGVTYASPGDGGDAGTRDDGSGTMRLVSFTAGGESGGATGFHMDANGNWTTTIRVPGPTFTSKLPTGQTRTFDCRQVQCGVFTIGAHGKASGANEKFAPITFTGQAAPAPGPGSAPPPARTGAAPQAGAAANGGGPGAPAAPGAGGAPEAPAAGTAAPGAPPPAPTPSTAPLADGSTVPLVVSASKNTGDGNAALIAAGAGAAVVLGIVLVAVLRRRRRRTTGP